ncbi:MAG: acyl-CoA synthetase [Streptosporangiaceae bacterium]
MPDYGIGSWPERRARISGAAVALRQAGRELSYAELAARVETLARALAGRGVGHGDRVAYLGLNDIAGFEVFFAAGRLGAVFVPLNTRLTASEIGSLLDDSRPAVMVYGPELASTVAAADPAAHGVGLLVPAAGAGPGGYAGLVAAGRDCPAVNRDVSLDDDAVILYTSGTTGRPKGAVLTHGNLTFNTMNQLAHADFLSTDTALCICPLFHATGLGQVTLPTMFKGGSVVVVAKFDPAAVLSLIERLHVTSFAAVPTMLQMMCDHPRFGPASLSSLRIVIYGGSSIAGRVATAWHERGVEILQGYGMTEAAPGVCLAVPGPAASRLMSAGVPHFFTDIALAPAGAGTAAPGEGGELLARGLNVFRGYWNRLADTRDAFSDGWFRSGDVVRIADDGWCYVSDRVKDVIISGGENIYPAEVEAAIDALPGVTASAVIAYPDERWGEVGLAFAVADPGAWTAESLRGALAGSLAAFKIPRHVRFVEDLPRTATGKVRRADLRAAAGLPDMAAPPTHETGETHADNR